MKKLIALLLAVVMVFALCACGSQTEPETTPTAEANEPTGTTGEVPGTDEAEAPADAAYTGESLTIIFSSTFSENETGGQLVTYFKNYLEELTGGAIKVNLSYGETLATSADELQFVSDGAVNMISLGHNPHADMIPLLCSMPDFAPGSVQNALDYFNYLLFENPETSAILAAEAEANNIKYLNVLAGGANTFVANFSFTDLSSLVAGSAAFGNMEAAKFESMGFTVEAVLPWDLYSSFETGKIDASQMASTPLASMSLFEVAPYWMYDNTYTGGNFFTVNLDWWNSLSAEAQAAIQDAATATEAYSVVVYEEALQGEADNLVSNGATLVEMTSEDSATWWSAVMESKKADSMASAAVNGNEAECEAVLNAAASFTGYTFK